MWSWFFVQVRAQCRDASEKKDIRGLWFCRRLYGRRFAMRLGYGSGGQILPRSPVRRGVMQPIQPHSISNVAKNRF